jgi:hypothetical protein
LGSEVQRKSEEQLTDLTPFFKEDHSEFLAASFLL